MRSMVELTPKGVALAEGLCQLECMLGGSMEAYRGLYGTSTRRGELSWRPHS